jgi:hypothetical protein
VEDQQVDLVDAELSGALLEAMQRLVVSVVADPDLGLEEDLRPIHIGTVYGLSNLALVAVGRSSIDVPVSGIECHADGVSGLIGRRLEHTEPKRW